MPRKSELLNTLEAAKLIGVSDTTIRAWLRLKVLPARRLIGKRYYFQRATLVRWLQDAPSPQSERAIPLPGRDLRLPAA